jgi:predicted DNA binding protein
MTGYRRKAGEGALRAQARRLASLRRRARHEGQPFGTYRLAIQLPPNAMGPRFNAAHPDLRVEIRNRMELDARNVLLEIAVFGPGAPDLLEEVRRYPEVSDVEVHAQGPDAAVYLLVASTPVVFEVIRRHRVLTRYPLVIEGGWVRFETVGTAEEIRQALEGLRRRVGPSHVEAVRRGPVTLGSLGLSRSQEVIFRAAMDLGYYDVPRRTSVSGLASHLGRSKSTVSEALTRIDKRLAESALQVSLVPLTSA